MRGFDGPWRSAADSADRASDTVDPRGQGCWCVRRVRAVLRTRRDVSSYRLAGALGLAGAAVRRDFVYHRLDRDAEGARACAGGEFANGEPVRRLTPSEDESARLLPNIYRQRAPDQTVLELTVRERTCGVASQQVRQHRISRGGFHHSVNSIRIGEQQLLKPDAVREFRSHFLFPRLFVAAERRAREIIALYSGDGGSRGMLAGHHGVVNSFRG